MPITKEIEIEELIERVPAAVNYLSKKGIRCIMCGEPIWGTLEEAAKEKGFSDEEIEGFVRDINELEKNSDLPKKGSFTGDIGTLHTDHPE